MKNKVHIVTGAAMGLGLAAAEEFARQGAKLVLVDYNEDGLQKAVKDLQDAHKGLEVLAVTADVSKESDVKKYVNAAKEKFGRIDGLYNNAGIEGRQSSMVDYDIDVFKKVVDINLMGVFYGIRYVLPVMMEQEYGRIVNVASVGGIRGVINQSPYVATKHAVVGLTKNTAVEYGRYGILTNAIAPGAILTPMVEEAFRQVNPDDPKAAETEYAQRNPMRKLGLPPDVAKVVAFLISEDNGYINGQTLPIDGGESNLYGNS